MFQVNFIFETTQNKILNPSGKWGVRFLWWHSREKCTFKPMLCQFQGREGGTYTYFCHFNSWFATEWSLTIFNVHILNWNVGLNSQKWKIVYCLSFLYNNFFIINICTFLYCQHLKYELCPLLMIVKLYGSYGSILLLLHGR